MRKLGCVLLATFVIAGAFHISSVNRAWSQENTAGDDVAAEGDANDDDHSDALDDIAIGELGSDGDDAGVPTPRRRRGAAASGAPRRTVDPSVRVALAHRFTKTFSAEIYGRAQIGALTNPLTSRSSTFATGVIANQKLGNWVLTTSFELAENHRDFYERRTYNGYEPGVALARSFTLGALPIAITPRAALSYRWADDVRYQRWKTELMAPVTFKITKQLDFVVTPKINWESYTDRPDDRRDVTGTIAGGLKYEIAKGASITASIGYETRHSNVGNNNFTRLKFAPQLSLKKEL